MNAQEPSKQVNGLGEELDRKSQFSINNFVFSTLCFLLGYLTGWILLIMSLAASIILLAPILWLANLIGQTCGHQIRPLVLANIIYPLILFVTAPLVSYGWVKCLSVLAAESRTPAAWSLACGAAIGFISYSKFLLLSSGSDAVQMTWAPSVATGVIGLACGAYAVSRVKERT